MASFFPKNSLENQIEVRLGITIVITNENQKSIKHTSKMKVSKIVFVNIYLVYSNNKMTTHKKLV